MSEKKKSISLWGYCWRVLTVLFILGLLAKVCEKPQKTAEKVREPVQKPLTKVQKPVEKVEKSNDLSAGHLQKAKMLLKEKKTDTYLLEAVGYLSAIKQTDKEFEEAQNLLRSVETELDNPARLLQQAKKLLKENPRHPEEAERKLESIKQGANEYLEAQKLLSQIREKQKSEAKERMVSIRKEYAKTLEYMFLDKGKMDTIVTVSGTNFTVLRIKWILWTRVSVHEMTKDGILLDTWKNMGFKKVIFVGGRFTGSWTFDLN